MELQDQVALITGGASRLGRHLGLALASAGLQIAFTYNTSSRSAESTAADIEALGRPALSVHCDQSDPAQVARTVEAVMARFGRLDVLVNNAAIFENVPLLDITPEDWDRVMAVNLRGPFLFLQEAARRMLPAGGGVIVNLADDIRPGATYIHHKVSKAGLVTLTQCSALALAPSIRVNAIAPGPVLQPVDWSDQDYAKLTAGIPLRQPGSPADVCQALLYLLAADFVTGQVLPVDGGLMIGF